MGKLLVILFSPPIQFRNTDTVFELSRAAIESGHEVTLFCDTEATYNLLSSQVLPDQTTPTNKIAQLIQKNVRVLVCRESARLRGIDVKKDLIEGVKESSLGELADLMRENDRVIAFGF
jgi:sulfur relay (sulfurtransferase) complex TusBCD TusD component (DsrE family)